MVAGRSESSYIVYNELAKHGLRPDRVFLENDGAAGSYAFLRRRIKRLGLVTVVGQLLFRLGIVPVLMISSRRRINFLKQSLSLDATPIDEKRITPVRSVNSAQVIDHLGELRPRVVVINGTRILSAEVLRSAPSVFLNMHLGVTPMYRGVYGAYWALAERKPESCGVTVHLVDDGIDTGRILGQALISPTKEDNVVTYPLLQLATGLPILVKGVKDASTDNMELRPYPSGESQLRSHPTLWTYIWGRLRRGTK
ncbi:MAG: hypothetical protein A2133_03010 [Actinobacteria bacterium RBG_16_64_13]|nr:MAG: hypothetical protein A2133_03010 [Actinobacteria bacterium RBG_16_64_13]